MAQFGEGEFHTTSAVTVQQVKQQWLTHYRAAASVDDDWRPPRALYPLLNTIFADLISPRMGAERLTITELSDLVTWWWLWKVPQLLERGAGEITVNPRVLYGCLGEYRRWFRARAEQVATLGLEEACRRRVDPTPPPAGWAPPPQWES